MLIIDTGSPTLKIGDPHPASVIPTCPVQIKPEVFSVRGESPTLSYGIYIYLAYIYTHTHIIEHVSTLCVGPIQANIYVTIL